MVTTFELNEQELEEVVSIVCSFGVVYSGVFEIGDSRLWQTANVNLYHATKF